MTDEHTADDAERRYWERHAANYDRSMGLLGRPLPRMLELAEQAVTGHTRVLEVAAGTGLVTMALARRASYVVATDYAEAMVQNLKARVHGAHVKNVECRQADIYDLPFAPRGFDAVVAANVLHLVPDLDGAIESLRRMLVPDGILVVPTFCHDETRLSWWASRVLALTGFPGHRRFTTASLRSALESSGAQIIREECISGLIPIGHIEARFQRSS